MVNDHGDQQTQTVDTYDHQTQKRHETSEFGLIKGVTIGGESDLLAKQVDLLKEPTEAPFLLPVVVSSFAELLKNFSHLFNN